MIWRGSRRSALCVSFAVSTTCCGVGCGELIGASFGEEAPIPSCELSSPPERPTTTGSGGDEEILLVINETDLGETVGKDGQYKYLTMGHDQDGSCSGPFDPPPCLPPAWTEGNPVDGPNGLDNAAGRLIQLQADLSRIDTVGTEEPNEDVRKGLAAPFGLLRVSEFSGFPEDELVTVDFYLPAAPSELGEDFEPPRFDGTYPFPIELSSMDGVARENLGETIEGNSRYRDTSAYVTQSTLVARFEGVPLGLFGSRVATSGLVVEGKLEFDRESKLWRVTDGMFSGQFLVDGMFPALPMLSVAALDRELCTDGPIYPAVRALLCSSSDLRVDGGTDYGDGVCNALSFGLRFKARPARFGPLVETLTDPPCAADVDPGRDDCW